MNVRFLIYTRQYKSTRIWGGKLLLAFYWHWRERTLTSASTRPAPIVPSPAMKKGTATWRVVWYHLSCLCVLLPKPSVLLWKSAPGSEFATEEMVTIELPLESVPPPRLGSDMSVLFFGPLGLFRPAIEKSIHLTLHRTTFTKTIINRRSRSTWSVRHFSRILSQLIIDTS